MSKLTSGACPVLNKSTHVFSVESSPQLASSKIHELAGLAVPHSWSTTLLPQVSKIDECNCIVSSHGFSFTHSQSLDSPHCSSLCLGHSDSVPKFSTCTQCRLSSTPTSIHVGAEF